MRPAEGDASGEATLADSVQESCSNLRESLDHVVCLLGRLALAWRVMEAGLGAELGGRREDLPPQASCWLVGDSLKTFLSDQVRVHTLYSICTVCNLHLDLLFMHTPILSYTQPSSIHSCAYSHYPIQQNQRLTLLVYRGHSEWSRLRVESSCYSIQKCLSTLQSGLKAHVRYQTL